MRITTLVLAASSLAGCATQPAAAPSAAVPPPPPTTVSSPARSGLAFDPPGAGKGDVPDLSRDARQPAADTGVAASTTTYNVSTSIQDTTADGAYSQQSTTERTGTVRH